MGGVLQNHITQKGLLDRTDEKSFPFPVFFSPQSFLSDHMQTTLAFCQLASALVCHLKIENESKES